MKKNTLIHLTSIVSIYILISVDLLATTNTEEENDQYPIHSPSIENKCELYKALERVFQAEKSMLSNSENFTGDISTKAITMQGLIHQFAQFQPTVNETKLHDILSKTVSYLTGFCNTYELILRLFQQELASIRDQAEDYVTKLQAIQMDLQKSQELSETQEESLKAVVKFPIIFEWIQNIKITHTTNAPCATLAQGQSDGLKAAKKEILNPTIVSLHPRKYWYSEIMSTRHSSLQMLQPLLDRSTALQKKNPVLLSKAEKQKTKSWFSCICGEPQG